jgi:allantoin racemase
MRILIVNANTSALVTEKLEAEARTVASPGTEIVAVTGTFGARVIASRAENAIAEHSAIALVSQYAGDCDAVVIGVSYDTGLRGARELLPIPVVGMTEAGLLTACMLGGRIGMITFERRLLPLYQEVVAGYALVHALPDGACSKALPHSSAGITPSSIARSSMPPGRWRTPTWRTW